jgi:hypothetical protein
MIILVMNERNEADLFLDKQGVSVFLGILNSYNNKDENDHDHIGFAEGLVCDNKVKGFNFEKKTMADEITIRFRSSLELK